MRYPDANLQNAFMVEGIRREMGRQKITQASLAHESGINKTTLRRKLSGLTPLRINEALAICEVLGIHLWELMRAAGEEALGYMETRYALGPKLVEVS